MCLACALPFAGCSHEKPTETRLWLISPENVAAEEEITAMIGEYDGGVSVSFVPSGEIDARLRAAAERGDAPDVMMLYADAIADLAEEKQLLDLSVRLSVSKVKKDDLSESARRACLYQGKPWAVPLFCDVYLLASNRALVATAPQTVEQLKAVCAELEKKGIQSFEKMNPERKSLLYEAVLAEKGGAMLNARKTKLEFTSESGKAAMRDCVAVLENASDEKDAMGAGKAAFSVMTTLERRGHAQKYPDAEIGLDPLFGLNRLQTTALAVNAKAPDQKKAFAVLEFLQGKTEKLSSLYKTYPASKEIKPLPSDEDAVVQLAQARPAPDLCGYDTLLTTYLPAAIDKAGKGVEIGTVLDEAAQSAAQNIWKGKRE